VKVGTELVELVTVRELERLLDRQRLLVDDSIEPPYWALVWSGARVAAEHLSRSGCVGKTVLDVGAGLGLVSIVAARLGALVTAVDRSPEAAAFLQASAHHAGLTIQVLLADVTQLPRGKTFDVVVAAELLYERDRFPELASALCGAVASRGELVIADAQRVDTSTFYREVTRLGMTEAFSSRVTMGEDHPEHVRLGAFRFL
jgi:predicted nicotinamide N-methyase